MKDIETLNPKWSAFMKTLFSSSMTTQKKRQTDGKRQTRSMSPRKLHLLDTRIKHTINSQSICQSVKDQFKFKSENPMTEKGRYTEILTINQDAM